MVDDALLDSLRRYDTPTLCNALERVAPERQGAGFTTSPLHCLHPKLPPMVGHARTATIRASRPSGRDATARRQAEREYYRYVASPPHPTVTVVQDLDAPPGFGAWWGEVNTHLHRGLGSLGVVTNGGVRDLDQVAEGFQVLAASVGPSHGFVHPVDFEVPVEVAGMRVQPGDLIHADRHGAVVVPREIAAALPETAEKVIAEERVLIEASREKGFGIGALERLLSGGDH